MDGRTDRQTDGRTGAQYNTTRLRRTYKNCRQNFNAKCKHLSGRTQAHTQMERHKLYAPWHAGGIINIQL